MDYLEMVIWMNVLSRLSEPNKVKERDGANGFP
jgi:hypothetical protein